MGSIRVPRGLPGGSYKYRSAISFHINSGEQQGRTHATAKSSFSNLKGFFLMNKFFEDEVMEEIFYDVWHKAGARLHSPTWGEAASRLWEAVQEKTTRRGLDGEREWEALGALVCLAARHFEDDLMAEKAERFEAEKLKNGNSSNT
jgi:hypothetical protein